MLGRFAQDRISDRSSRRYQVELAAIQASEKRPGFVADRSRRVERGFYREIQLPRRLSCPRQIVSEPSGIVFPKINARAKPIVGVFADRKLGTAPNEHGVRPMESVPIFVFILAVIRKMRVKMVRMTNLLDLRGG